MKYTLEKKPGDWNLEKVSKVEIENGYFLKKPMQL